MTVGDRIEIILKHKNLKKVEFAAAVGIDQSYVTKIIKGTSKASPRLLDDICRTFGINREWLETGEGEMSPNHDMSIIDRLASEFELDDKSREFIENFLRLPPNVRALVAQAVEQAAKFYPRKPDIELTPEESAEVVRQERQDQLDAQKRAIITSSASTGLNGSSKKIGNSP